MPPIKIGQIGVGHAHAAGKMEAFRSSPDYEVVGVVEPDAALQQAAAQAPAYADVPWLTQEQLLNTAGLQAVAVETRVGQLLETAAVCVQAGLHIHLDKPAGESLPAFRKLLDAAATQHLAVQMGYMYRYNPGLMLAHDLLRRGWLGEPFELHAVMSKVINPATRAELAAFPGGVLFELGCHLVDATLSLLGPPQRVDPFPQQALATEDSLVDNMLAVLSYPRALATVKSSALEVEGFARRHLTICGTEGTLHIQPLDSPQARLALAAPRGDYRSGYQEIVLPPYERYVDDVRDLAAVIRGEKDLPWSYEHDYAVQQTLLAACGLLALPAAR